jgi:hypothetical protein
MLEYAQTEQDRWARENAGESAHKVLVPPDGEAWTLHSWRPSPHNSTKLLMVWQREVPSK